jgi:NDP-sugar pyrophosphorylase family protein
MRPATAQVPKALLPVAGRPFADWQLAWLAGQGVTDVVLSTGHLGPMLRQFVGDGARWGLTVAYAEEGDQLRGTGGAVRLASDLGLLEDRFFVLYGDSYLTVDIGVVERAFVESGRPALMTVYDNAGRFDQSNVALDGARVARYEKGLAHPPPEMHYIDYGLSALERRVIDKLVPPGAVADLAEVYGSLVRRDQMAALVVTERFYEVGSADGLADLEAHLGPAPR